MDSVVWIYPYRRFGAMRGKGEDTVCVVHMDG